MFDDLGDFIKNNFENRTRYLLPRRTYTIVRVDGKGFSKYTTNLKKPFDFGLMEDMDQTAVALCKNLAGAVCAYVFSDEISVLMTDFANPQTDALYDGNIQKIVSIAASMTTAHFNRNRVARAGYHFNNTDMEMAMFDGRTFIIPDRDFVVKYFQWRQMDATRNSISSACRSVFSHREMDGKNIKEQQAMLLTKDINWNDYSVGAKRGRLIVKRQEQMAIDPEMHPKYRAAIEGQTVMRGVWKIEEPPIFTKDAEILLSIIPSIPSTIMIDTDI